jgi:hypothetical protein
MRWHQRRKLLALDQQPIGDTEIEPARHRGDDAADRRGRMADDALRQRAQSAKR